MTAPRIYSFEEFLKYKNISPKVYDFTCPLMEDAWNASRKQLEKELREACFLIQNSIVDIHSCWCGEADAFGDIIPVCNFCRAKNFVNKHPEPSNRSE